MKLTGIVPNFEIERCIIPTTNLPPDILNIDIGWLHIGAVGLPAIIALGLIIVGVLVSRYYERRRSNG
jgi:hypothetical protein